MFINSVPLLLVFLSLVDDFSWEEVVRIDFINRRENDSMGVWTVDDSDGEGVNINTFVYMVASPDCALIESIPVFGVIQDFEESYSVLKMIFVEH